MDIGQYCFDIRENKYIVFKAKMKFIEHPFSEKFQKQENNEVLFKRIISYFINTNVINGNIIDVGAWIGNNSISWAMSQNQILLSFAGFPQGFLVLGSYR